MWETSFRKMPPHIHDVVTKAVSEYPKINLTLVKKIFKELEEHYADIAI